MRGLFSTVGVTMLVAVWGAGAVAQSPPPHGDVQAGRRLALRVCDACHIVAAHQEMAPLVSNYGPSWFAVAGKPGTTAQSIEAFLAHGHPLGQMPYPDLSATQIADVTAYILSLRGRR